MRGAVPGDVETDPAEMSLTKASGLGRAWQTRRIEGKALASRLSIERQNIEHQLGGRRMSRLYQLADRRDQQPLSPKEGPLRLIVPDEKRQGRWVRQVTSVTIRRAE